MQRVILSIKDVDLDVPYPVPLRSSYPGICAPYGT
jgi:hypothetical protein